MICYTHKLAKVEKSAKSSVLPAIRTAPRANSMRVRSGDTKFGLMRDRRQKTEESDEDEEKE